MNRTTRAMARLGALAVVAGTVLSAPFATGIANAAVTLGVTDNATAPFSSLDGSVTFVSNFPNGGNHDATFTVTGATPGDNLVLKIVGSSTAYFPTNAGAAGPPAIYASGGGVNATCTADTNGECFVDVADTKSESVNVSVVDTSASPAASEIVTVKFNAIHFTTPTCPLTDIDSFANCATQAQTNVPITVTVQYLEAGTGPSGKTLHALLNQNAKFSGTQPAGTTVDSDQAAHCITTNGNCSFTIVDAFATDAGVGISVFIQNADASPYPGTNTFGFADQGARAKASLQLSSHSVAPARVDIVGAQLLGPTPQTTNAAQAAGEPGDVLLLEYYVTAACAPQTALGYKDCDPSNAGATNPAPIAGDPSDDGTYVANTAMQVTTDHGFFTPVCSPGAPTDPTLLTVIDYADCSFATTPTAGTPVGNVTNNGQTITVPTNQAGEFVVALSIGRDAAFDQNGNVTMGIKVGGLTPVLTSTGGNDTQHVTSPIPQHVLTSPTYTAQTCPNYVATWGFGGPVTVSPSITTPIPDSQGLSGCPLAFAWTTREQPLNGGTAKLVGIPALSQPNNTAIITENNISASDSGTVNVPDVDRVVFVIHETDQFGNLTSGALSMGNAEGALTPTLVKTGPDTLYGCTGFTTVDPCTNGITGPPGITNSAQPDGTTTQTATGVIGSYTNFVQDSLNPGAMPNGQIRGQVDNATAAIPAHPAGFNDGWGTATAGVNDGTTVLTLTWSAPTTTFTTFVVGPPNAASYGTGTAAAATDTFTLNFYNQLAQPVITFTVKPGSTVQTGTAVTVEATVKDQFGNPIVLQPVDAVRSGANESTCVPAQGVNNGGNVNNALFTNTSGVTGYTFTCTGAGVSNVSMVVLGPGNTQLAQGREAITFTGSNVGGGQKKEKPTLRITSPKKHVLVLHVATHPSLNHVTVHFYKVVHGLKILVGGAKTGGAGHAHLKIGGLKSGSTHRYTAKVVKLSNKYKSVFAKSRAHKVS